MPYPRTIYVDRRTIHGKDSIALSFKYDQEFIALCKHNRFRWFAEGKAWYLPNTPPGLDLVRATFTEKAELNFADYHNKRHIPVPQTKPLRQTTKEHPEPVAKALERYEQFLKIKRYSANTIKTYYSLLEGMLLHFEKDPSELVLSDIERYFYDVIIRKNYANSTHRQIIGAIKLAQNAGVLSMMKDVELYHPKKERHLPEVLSKEEVLSIIKSIQNLKHRTIISILYSCGLRIGELLNLQVNHLDFERRVISIKNAKGRKDRIVMLSKKLGILLHNYLEVYKPEHYLIEGTGGSSYSPASVRKILKRACREAKIRKRVTPHTLRHSFATHLVEMQVNLRVIQKLLGHSKPETTAIYTHISNDMITNMPNPFDEIINLHEELQRIPANDTKNVSLARSKELL
jgi:integrase/recombinase XerD